MSIVKSLSPRAIAAPESGIVEVVNYARGREGLLPLWVGEGDLPTPDFISRAAMDALASGETFYTWQRGIPELRQALSDYYFRHFGFRLPVEHFYVTGSGMQAIQIAVQTLTSPGDEFVYLTPAWPNSPPPSKSRVRAPSASSCSSKVENGRSISTASKPRSRRKPGASSSTRRRTRRAGRRRRRILPISWRWPAGTISGSWPMKSTPSTILPAAGRPLSSM
ncbi:hypothetical protein JOH51_004946 [Rhizobium leguminosarum]|nr:hypothetical protein [Rhizobium leguminosarum]